MEAVGRHAVWMWGGLAQVSTAILELHLGYAFPGNVEVFTLVYSVRMFQMQEVPEDFFVDIVSCNNFLVTSLSDLFANIKEHEDALTQLKTRAISFENHLTKKFGWSFNADDDEEFAPTIVYD